MLRIVSAASIVCSRNSASVSIGLVYSLSASNSKTVGFRILVPLTFSAYFGVTNYSTNFRPIVFEHPEYIYNTYCFRTVVIFVCTTVYYCSV